MSKEIKTKTTTKDIKVFDRAADVSLHMKRPESEVNEFYGRQLF